MRKYSVMYIFCLLTVTQCGFFLQFWYNLVENDIKNPFLIFLPSPNLRNGGIQKTYNSLVKVPCKKMFNRVVTPRKFQWQVLSSIYILVNMADLGLIMLYSTGNCLQIMPFLRLLDSIVITKNMSFIHVFCLPVHLFIPSSRKLVVGHLLLLFYNIPEGPSGQATGLNNFNLNSLVFNVSL